MNTTTEYVAVILLALGAMLAAAWLVANGWPVLGLGAMWAGGYWSRELR